ncbi:MAG: DUF4190 domain-containing protein [Candidatus Pacearchaeota archaeon]
MENERSWSIFAIIGFILSFFGIFAILGIIFSSIGISETSDRKRRGRGLAIAGLIIGIIVFIFSIITVIGILVAIPISGLLNPGTIDESNINGRAKITVSGINFNTDINENRTIILEINGIANEIRVSKNTNLYSTKINGVSNQLFLCEGIHNIEPEKSGVDNRVIFNQC